MFPHYATPLPQTNPSIMRNFVTFQNVANHEYLIWKKLVGQKSIIPPFKRHQLRTPKKHIPFLAPETKDHNPSAKEFNHTG